MDDLMDKTGYGIAALRKFGAVPEGFHVFQAEWLGDKPEDWKTMRVTGAQFVGSKRIPRTTMSTIVTVEEMEAAERATPPQPGDSGRDATPAQAGKGERC
jgi:hypothetical protein